MIRRALLSALLLLPMGLSAQEGGAAAAPAPEVQALSDALAGDDADAKRAAIRALANKSVGNDDQVLPLLVRAVADRQASDLAISALRSRTGLSPPPYVGQSHYPGYPSSDSATAWNAWLAERTKDKEEQAQLKLAEETAKKAALLAKEAKDEATGTSSGSALTTSGSALTPADGATAAHPARHYATDDLGKPVRIVFKNGSNLICYILTRRTDADGTLLSLRIVHRDGSGEETLDAAMIARIEEDVH